MRTIRPVSMMVTVPISCGGQSVKSSYLNSVVSVQWPSLLRPRSPIMGNMPAMVLDRYSACQTVCLCGVFPEINRAWASVDNSFFMWRFDRW